MTTFSRLDIDSRFAAWTIKKRWWTSTTHRSFLLLPSCGGRCDERF